MQAAFEEIHREHRGQAGDRRADEVIDFFERFLPNRFGVGTGACVSSDGQESPQLDVIVYDALNAPVFDNSRSSLLVPVEAVAAVIEVASSLSASKLREDARKIQTLKAMRRDAFAPQARCAPDRSSRSTSTHPPIIAAVFGMTTRSLVHLRDELIAIDQRTALEERVDLVYVNGGDGGVIFNIATSAAGKVMRISSRPELDTTRQSMTRQSDDAGDMLLLFYRFIAAPLLTSCSDPIDITRYTFF